MTIRPGLLALVILLLFSTVFATENISDDNEVVELYSRGKKLMNDGDWLQASKLFDELAGRFSNSPNLDLFLFNRAKAQYYFGEYHKAIGGFSYFITTFQNSKLVAAALYFRGNAYYLSGDATRAARDYIEALAVSKDARIDDLALRSLETALRNASSIKFGPSEFGQLPPDKKCQVIKKLLPIYQQAGESQQVKALARECAVSIQRDQQRPTRTSRSDIEIAVLLPLSGELSGFANDIYNGVVIAAEKLRAESGIDLNISPFDTQGDAINAGQLALQLMNDRNIDAVIGPLTSEETAVVSAAMGQSDLPLLIPAATQAGLTKLSSSTFQLSPNIDLQGVRMAEYAANTLGADTAVIITPTSSDPMRMAQAFTTTFEQMGGTIFAIEYYRPRDNDFGKQIRDIKSMVLGFPPDSTFIIDAAGDTLELDEQPVRFDAMFLPGDPATLRLLIPQVNFYNIVAPLLGSDGWGGEAVLKLGDNITKGAIFPSPFVALGNSETYFEFASLYDQRYGEKPTRLAALGFDAMQLISGALKAGKKTRGEINAGLRNVTGYSGASGEIAFGPSRENIKLPLYRIHLNQAIRIDLPDTSFVPTETGN